MTTSTTPDLLTPALPCHDGPISPEAAAAVRAAEEFARTHDQSVLIRLLGTSDTFMTHEELMEMRASDLADDQ